MYLFANAGAPVPSSHCAKNGVSSSFDCACATVCTFALRTDLSVYCDSTPRRNFRNTSSPISHRSMWKTIAPFSSVIDWNCGENGSSRPSVVSGSVS